MKQTVTIRDSDIANLTDIQLLQYGLIMSALRFSREVTVYRDVENAADVYVWEEPEDGIQIEGLRQLTCG